MDGKFSIFTDNEKKLYYIKFRDFRDFIFEPFAALLIDFNVKPNYLTFLGVLMVVPFVLFFSYNPWVSFIFLVLGLFFDGIDGVVARKLGVVSEFGGFVDAFVDYFVYFVVFFTLVYFGVIDGFWGGIHAVNYLLMQFFIVYCNFKRIAVFPVIRSKFIVYLFLFILLLFGENYFDSLIVFLSVYMFFTNLFIFFRIKSKISN